MRDFSPQDEIKMERQVKRNTEMETCCNNIKLLTEMLNHYSPSSPSQDKELMKASHTHFSLTVSHSFSLPLFFSHLLSAISNSLLSLFPLRFQDNRVQLIVIGTCTSSQSTQFHARVHLKNLHGLRGAEMTTFLNNSKTLLVLNELEMLYTQYVFH